MMSEEDLLSLLEAEGELHQVDGIAELLCILRDEGEGADSVREGVSVRVASLACLASAMTRPAPGRAMTVDGEKWIVAKADDLAGLLKVQIYKERS